MNFKTFLILFSLGILVSCASHRGEEIEPLDTVEHGRVNR